MKKILFLFVAMLAMMACNRPVNGGGEVVGPDTIPGGGGTDPEEDVRLAFVGSYELTIDAEIFASCDNPTIAQVLPDTLPFHYVAYLDILIDPDDNDALKVSGFYNCRATVSGNKLLLESHGDERDLDLGDVVDVDFLQGIVIPLSYTLNHAPAELVDGVLTWTSEGQGSSQAEIMGVAISLTGTGNVHNVARLNE